MQLFAEKRTFREVKSRNNTNWLIFQKVCIIITFVKRICPSKNFFYKINNPLLIYFTPLEKALLLPNRVFSHLFFRKSMIR